MNSLLGKIGLVLCLGPCAAAMAGVSAEEAARLGKDLTPLGAEKAGNASGTIPAWTGGITPAGAPITGRRPDPFASDKVLYTVTAQNQAQYGEQLSDGLKALFAKYPDFRMDVYPTRRTAAAPVSVYENTRKNATRASLNGDKLVRAFGGVPFPIPKSGAEAMWNHQLRWNGADYRFDVVGYFVTPEGKPVLTLDAKGDNERPYYAEGGSPEAFEKDGAFHFNVRITNAGPPVRAGEAFLNHQSLDASRDEAWVYLTGQRRVRKLPNACCDFPAAQTAGIMWYDEQLLFTGRLDRFDWKLIGKKEMLIPYNTNRLGVPTTEAAVIGQHFLNPDHVRWELHRVWVVEATLRQGQRHQAVRSRYYLDEDTWMGVLADRWDQKGQLWRMLIQYPLVAPDMPGVVGITFGMYELSSGAWFINGLGNSKPSLLQFVRPYPSEHFQPEAMAAQNVR